MKILFINGENSYLVEHDGKHYSVYINPIDSEIGITEVFIHSWLKFSPYAQEYEDSDKELEQRIFDELQKHLIK